MSLLKYVKLVQPESWKHMYWHPSALCICILSCSILITFSTVNGHTAFRDKNSQSPISALMTSGIAAPNKRSSITNAILNETELSMALYLGFIYTDQITLWVVVVPIVFSTFHVMITKELFFQTFRRWEKQPLAKQHTLVKIKRLTKAMPTAVVVTSLFHQRRRECWEKTR